MMLGHRWRLRASNSQNQQITVTVRARLFKFASDGSLVWSGTEVTLMNGASLAATTGSDVGTAQDNATDKWMGAELTVLCTAAAGTDGSGTVSIFLERSSDAGTTWPTAGRGILVGTHTLVNADGANQRVRNLTIR